MAVNSRLTGGKAFPGNEKVLSDVAILLMFFLIAAITVC